MTIKKFQALPFKEKVNYLLFDFTWQILLGAFLILILGSWIYLEYMVEPPVLRVEMINGAEDSPDSEAFSEFMDAQGLSCTDENVKVSKQLQIAKPTGEYQCSMHPLIFCKAFEGRTDLYFWDDQDVARTLSLVDLADLRTVLPMEVLEKCRDRLIYTGPILDGGYPCGIHLKDCPWISENGFYGDCAVGISKTAQDPGLVSEFIQYIT